MGWQAENNRSDQVRRLLTQRLQDSDFIRLNHESDHAMYNGLQPLLPTPMSREAPDGTTAWSDEVGLPGERRLLAWTVVQEDSAVFDIHVLWDTSDVGEAMEAALLHAQAFFGPNITGGVVIATLNSVDNAVAKRFGNLGWITESF
jgi:hypothetical protein